MIKVNEIFLSLQGEGSDIGVPTIFIRLAGCNLRCTYCDTEYAFSEGIEMHIKEIAEKTKKWRCKRICITGGEPLLQEGIYELAEMLLKDQYEISVETNGSIDISKITELDVMIKMDMKLPSSGENHNMIMENIYMLRNYDEIKFIVGDKKDYKCAIKIIEKYKPKCIIIMQPTWKKAKKLADWILEDELNVRFSVQLHKILWGETIGK